MTVEYLGEQVFLQELKSAGWVWVAKNAYENVHAMEIDQEGFSLPVWSKRERVVEYLKNARLVGPQYEPHPVPLDVFSNAWLSNKMMAITELQINPDGKTTRVLCLTIDEFRAAQD